MAGVGKSAVNAAQEALNAANAARKVIDDAIKLETERLAVRQNLFDNAANSIQKSVHKAVLTAIQESLEASKKKLLDANDEIARKTKELEDARRAELIAKGINASTETAQQSEEIANITNDLTKSGINTTKNDDIIKNSLDDGTLNTAIKNTEDGAKVVVKEAGKQTKYDVAKKVVAAAAVVGIGGYFAIEAFKKYNNKNGAKFNIISIKNYDNSNTQIKAIITFTPSEDITINDRISLEKTNCVPELSGEFDIFKVNSRSQIVIISNKKITEGTQGTMTLLTTYENQLSLVLKDAAKGTGDVVGNTTGSLFDGITQGLFGNLGFDINNIMYYIVIFLVIIIFICIVYKYMTR